MSDLAITCHDGGTATHVVLTRYEHHQHKNTLHHISNIRLGRQAQSTPRQRRLETRPGTICGTRHAVQAALDRPFRFGTQHPTTPLQRKMEGPKVRSGGRTPPPRRKLAPRRQLVQPSLAPITQPRPKTMTEQRIGYNSPPKLDKKSMAPCTYRDGF
jgi:hypothetical protein